MNPPSAVEPLPWQRISSARLLAVLFAAEFTAAFELTMVYSGIKTFIAVFKDPVGVGWLVTSYLLVAGGATALCGRLGDLFGRRRLLLIMLALAASGSFFSAFSSQLPFVIAGRAVQGFAGAILPLCYGLVRENLPPEKVPFGTGILAGSAIFAAMAGLVVGGFVIDHFPWHTIFLVSGGMAILSLVLSAALLPPSRPSNRDGPLDLLGGLLFVPAILLLLIGISHGNDWGWLSAPILCLLGGGVALLAIWIAHELRIPDPLIDVRLFASRNVVLANVAMCAYALAPQQGQLAFLLFQQSPSTGVGVGLSATTAGLLAVPAQLLAVLAAPFVAKSCARHGSRPILRVAGILFLAQMGVLLLIVFQPKTAFVLLGLTIAALASILLLASAPNVVIAQAPSDRTSEATGMMQVLRSIMQAVGAQLIAATLATSTMLDPATGAGPFPTREAFILTIALLIPVSAGTLLAGLLLRLDRKPEQP